MRFKVDDIITGASLTVLQILLALMMAPGGSVSQSYSKLCTWDCAWYASITNSGYHSSIPPVAQNGEIANVAFFPGYPYLARIIHLVLGLSSEISLLIVAQLGCLAFWTILSLLLRHWRIPFPIAYLVFMAILAHPAAFYLVVGYSESLFLSSLLFFILTAPKAARQPRWSASLSGLLMSATRIVGAPIACFPVLNRVSHALSSRRLPSVNELFPSILTSLIAAMGTILFLVYCKLHFGQYDLYMETQRIGWGIIPDYGAILKWESFQQASSIDRIATVGTIFTFLAFAIIEILLHLFTKISGLRKRIPLYAIAFLIFFVTLSGLKSMNYRSMIRYTLPWYILLILCLAHLTSRLPRLRAPVAHITFVLIVMVLLIVFGAAELPHLRQFLNGQWFA